MADTVDLNRITEYEDAQKERKKKIRKLAKLVKKSEYTVFYTGAGVSTSAGVPDYRGPKGCWTMQAKGKRATSKVPMTDAQPTPTHMAMATLIRLGMAHYVVTTNLDGIHRKSGLKQHDQICNLHGCIYVERCTKCHYDFERNYHVRNPAIHVHDHTVGTCSQCGSKKKDPNKRVTTQSVDQGTKDTHINFEEYLDDIEWADADKHCKKADLVIVAGTSMTLRHITHLPFYAQKNGGKVVIINLQKTPDDKKCDLRIFAKTDEVFINMMKELNVEIDPIPLWKPRDYVPIKKIPSYIHPYYLDAAKRLDALIKYQEKEEKKRNKEAAKKKKEEEKRKKKDAAKNAKQKEKEVEEEEKEEDDGTPDLEKVVIGNTHKELGKDKHEWKVFVKGSTEEEDAVFAKKVSRVEFELHETFCPNQFFRKQAPFEVSRIGWGTFDVKVQIFWKNGKVSQLVHELDFGSDVTANTLNLTYSKPKTKNKKK